MKDTFDTQVIVRVDEEQWRLLSAIIFSRYKTAEWGSFIRLGWHETDEGMILTLAGIDTPQAGDLNPDTWITEITDQYTSRILRLTEEHPFAVGIVHSHPEGYGTGASSLDDDMENYYSTLLKPYIPDRPFVSLIFALSENGLLSASGRVYRDGAYLSVSRFVIGNRDVFLYSYEKSSVLRKEALKRVERLASAFSTEAAELLAKSTVGIVGASGTGSPCIELLARAGVGKLIIIDPDVFADSNLERVHGSGPSDIEEVEPKVVIAGRHVKFINPNCEVVLIKGKIPQTEVVNELLSCNLVLGCTDLHSARVALSDLSLRYLVSVIDVGVSMEGKNGSITGQVVQINRLFPSDPCVYCRSMVDSKIVRQELMTEEEKSCYRTQAQQAIAEGKNGQLYWVDVPQLNTVGYLTTLAGSLVSGYAIGFLTGRFKMPKNRVELNLSPYGIQVVEIDETHDPECCCKNNVGAADQKAMAVMSVAPTHWEKPVFL